MQVSDTERTRRDLVKSAGDPRAGQEGHAGRTGGEHTYCRSRSVFWRGLMLSGLFLLTLITGCATRFGRTPTIPPSL
jgi:hypothetical protein